jgi:hypothetical protein
MPENQVTEEKVHNEVMYDIEQQPTLMFEQAEVPLTEHEWQQLADILGRSDYEHIIGGDAHENHSVWVSRYFNDVVSPKALSEQSEEVAAIVMSPKMRDFYKRFTGTDQLCLRRCQANRLLEGDYIGEHKDQDSSPDYFATVVFHFSPDYSGGYFQTGNDELSSVSKKYKPGAKTVLVNNCSVPHQVTPVEKGERLTLACFLSTSFAPNQHSPVAFKVDKVLKH